MAVIYENLFTSLGDFTAVSPGGAAIVDINSGQARIKSEAGVGAGLNTLGFYQSSNIQTGADGHTFFVKWRCDQSAANRDCWILVSNTASITTAAHPGADFQNGGSYNWDGNSGGADAFTWAINTDYYVKALVNANGTITFSISTTINGSYTTIGTSVVADSFNAIGAGLRLVAQIVDQAGNAPTMNVDNYYYTDNGSLAPSVPTNLVATAEDNDSILLTFTDNGTATSETGIKIEWSTSPDTNFNQVATVAQGVGQYAHTGLDAGVKYYYRIRGYKTAGGVDFNTSYTSITSAITNAAPTVDAGEDAACDIGDGIDLDGSATDDGFPQTSKDSSNCSATTGWTIVEDSGAHDIVSDRFKFSPAVGVTNGDLAAYRSVQVTAEVGDEVTFDFQVGADNNDAPFISVTDEARSSLTGTENRVSMTIGGSGTFLGQRSLAGTSFLYPINPARNADASVVYNGKFRFGAGGIIDMFVKESTADNFTHMGACDATFNFLTALYFNVSGYRDVSQTGLFFDNFSWTTPAVLTYAWTKTSGPGTVNFTDDTDPTTHADFSAGGVYVLRLTASDGETTGYDEVTITVTAPAANTGTNSAKGKAMAQGWL